MEMRVKRESKHSPTLPPQLTRAAHRRVRLTASGFVLVAWAVVLFIAGPLVGIMLYSSATTIEEPQVATEAEVIKIQRTRGENAKVKVTYRYRAGERHYEGVTTLRKRDRGRFAVGSVAQIRYLASRPGTSWIEGYGPRRLPIAWALIVPPVLMFTAIGLLLPLRHQARLLAEGRFAFAKITKIEKGVHYEWTLLSGAKRSAHYELGTSKPPTPGTSLPIVYDRDNPQRHARYPLALVTVAA
jgi:hypothetical protein